MAIDLTLAFMLVPRMGVNGAALASSLAYGTAILVAVAVFLKQTRTSPAVVFHFGRADIDDYRELFTRLRAMLVRAPAGE